MEGVAKFPVVILMVGDCYGNNIPLEFAKDCEGWEGISEWAMTTLLSGPDNPNYWEAWNSVTDNASLKTDCGKTYYLYQDGDLWAVRDFETELEQKEYLEFFGDD